MRIYTIILFAVLVFVSCKQSGGNLDYTVVSSKGFDEIYDVRFLSNGDRIVCGVASGNLLLNGNDSTDCYHGSYDAFIAAFDESGNLKWHFLLGDQEWDEANSLCIDNKENVYVAGHFKGQLILPVDTLFSNGNSDCFILKFSKTGELLKATSFGSYGKDEASDLIYDNGVLFYYGMYSGDFHDSIFSRLNKNYQGNLDNCIISFKEDLSPTNMVSFGGHGEEMAGELCIEGSNLYACGGFSDSIRIQDQLYSSKGNKDLFVLSLDLKMLPDKFYSEGGKGDDFANSVVSINNELIWAGQYTPEGRQDYDVVINLAGRKFVFGGPKNDWAKGIANSDSQSWHFACVIQDTIVLSGQKYISNGSYDNLLLSIHSTKGIVNQYVTGSKGEDGFSRIVKDNKGQIWACGWYSGSWKNDNLSILSNEKNGSDGILIKLKTP